MSYKDHSFQAPEVTAAPVEGEVIPTSASPPPVNVQRLKENLDQAKLALAVLQEAFDELALASEGASVKDVDKKKQKKKQKKKKSKKNKKLSSSSSSTSSSSSSSSESSTETEAVAEEDGSRDRSHHRPCHRRHHHQSRPRARCDPWRDFYQHRHLPPFWLESFQRPWAPQPHFGHRHQRSRTQSRSHSRTRHHRFQHGPMFGAGYGGHPAHQHHSSGPEMGHWNRFGEQPHAPAQHFAGRPEQGTACPWMQKRCREEAAGCSNCQQARQGCGRRSRSDSHERRQ